MNAIWSMFQFVRGLRAQGSANTLYITPMLTDDPCTLVCRVLVHT